jgi:5,6-dimethylbenzimidazole synthase
MLFSNIDSKKLLEIIKARRDVRGNRFIDKEIEDFKLDMILEAGISAPSVGYSQPWKFVIIRNKNIKNNILKNFEYENIKAKNIFKSKDLYQKLKLEGIKEAPLNIAVLYTPPKKDTLGMTSMKKMGEYSVVCAIENMWLMARALNIGMGWVSILDEDKVLKEINAKDNSKLIAYLCLGYVDKFYPQSELKTIGWEQEKIKNDVVEYL